MREEVEALIKRSPKARNRLAMVNLVLVVGLLGVSGWQCVRLQSLEQHISYLTEDCDFNWQ